MEKLKNTKILGVVGNIIIIISLFCTWATVSSPELGISQSEQLKNTTNGGLTFLLCLFSLMVIASERISPKFFKGLTNVKLTLISSIIQLILLIKIVLDVSNIQAPDYITYHFGLGFYLMCIGVILCLAFPFIYKQEKIVKGE